MLRLLPRHNHQAPDKFQELLLSLADTRNQGVGDELANRVLAVLHAETTHLPKNHFKTKKQNSNVTAR